MEENQNNPQEKKKKSPVRLIVIGLLVIVGGIYGFKKISFALSHESTDNAQVETQLTPVLPRVPGYVKTIAVNDYDSVKAGQLLVELDTDELQTQLAQMQADVKASEADILNAKASLNSTVVSLGVNRGDIDLNNVKVEQALEDYNRNKNLFADQAITKKQLDDSRFAYEQTKQEVANSHTGLGSAESRVSVIKSNIARAEAALDAKKAAIQQQELKISYSKIYAPAAGKIGKRNITAGQFVQAGTPLFSIVNDTTYWVVANFKETQIRQFHEGMEVDMELDAFPDQKIKGTISSLSEATGARFSLLPPDNASGNFVKVTQRVPVKIAIKNIEQYRNILRAGLSVNVDVPVK